ncbi:MAG: YvcK family protein [Clostridia bacterium]|nr:YvcK family protein [Clostridia bacterium]
MEKKKIVVLGGGTGASNVLKGLKYFPVDITAIITVSDNGRSTGRLRKEFSTPAVGDIRHVLSNLSTLPDEVKNIMEYRMSTYSDLNGHSMGNLILTSFFKETGNLKKSIEYMSKLLRIEHTVLPLSEDYLTLMGETDDGEIIEGEEEITYAKKHYKRIFYKEDFHVLPEVLNSIKEADLIILSMGSLYTSILPHLICTDVAKAINNAKAKVIYVCNAMTQPGETDNFGVSDHVNVLESYIGKDRLNAVIVSNNVMPAELLKKYSTQEQKDQVVIDYENIQKAKYELIESDLLTTADGTIKHDTLKLSSLIFLYLMNNT